MPHSNGFANLDRHKLDERRSAVPGAASEPLHARSVPYTEPTNEELGIKPDRRPVLAYVLLVLALVTYGVWALLA